MFCDAIRHVSPLIPDVAASIFRKNFKQVLFMFTLFKYNHYKVIISSGEHKHVLHKYYKIWNDRNYPSNPFFKFRLIRKKNNKLLF